MPKMLTKELLAEAIYLLVARGQGANTTEPATSPIQASGSTQRQVDRAFQQITGLTQSASPDQLLKAMQQRFRKKDENGIQSLEYIPGPHVATIDLEPYEPTRKEWFRAFDGAQIYAKEVLAKAQALIENLTPIIVTDQETLKARRSVLSQNLASFLNDPGPEPRTVYLVEQIMSRDLPFFGHSLGLIMLTPGSGTQGGPTPNYTHVVTQEENLVMTNFLALQSLVKAAVQTWADFQAMLKEDLGFNLRRLSDAMEAAKGTLDEIAVLWQLSGVQPVEQRIPFVDVDDEFPPAVASKASYTFKASLADILEPLRQFLTREAPALLSSGGKIGVAVIKYRCEKERKALIKIIQSTELPKFTGDLGELELGSILTELEKDLYRVEDIAYKMLPQPDPYGNQINEPTASNNESSPEIREATSASRRSFSLTSNATAPIVVESHLLLPDTPIPVSIMQPAVQEGAAPPNPVYVRQAPYEGSTPPEGNVARDLANIRTTTAELEASIDPLAAKEAKTVKGKTP